MMQLIFVLVIVMIAVVALGRRAVRLLRSKQGGCHCSGCSGGACCQARKAPPEATHHRGA